MRIAVFGAGAVGSHLAVRLVLAGHDVSVIARGPHLQAIQQRGLTLKAADKTETVHLRATDWPAGIGPQDIVISTLKSHSLPVLADAIEALAHPGTCTVFAQNGIPWWFARHSVLQRPLPSEMALLDPKGVLAAAFTGRIILAGVIESSNALEEPGVVINTSPRRNSILVGEIEPSGAAAAHNLRAILRDANLDSPPLDDIRRGIWKKLIVNLSVSLIALLTRHPADISNRDRALRAVSTRVMQEALALADAYGFDLTADFLDRDAFYSRVPHHKSSILQDFEAGREMEIASLITVPLALARAAEVSTPTLETLGSLATALPASRELSKFK